MLFIAAWGKDRGSLFARSVPPQNSSRPIHYKIRLLCFLPKPIRIRSYTRYHHSIRRITICNSNNNNRNKSASQLAHRHRRRRRRALPNHGHTTKKRQNTEKTKNVQQQTLYRSSSFRIQGLAAVPHERNRRVVNNASWGQILSPVPVAPLVLGVRLSPEVWTHARQSWRSRFREESRIHL